MTERTVPRPWLWAAVLALGLAFNLSVLGAPTGFAQAEDRQQRAGEFFGLGVKRFEAEDYQGALDAFEQAYRLAPHHAVRVNMAACFAKLNRPVEALFNYERFLHESDGQVAPAQKREVDAAVAELEDKVSEVNVTLEPANATLHIDGREPRALPDGRIVLAEGSYLVEVLAPGYDPYQGKLDVTGGTPKALDVRLERSVAAAPVPMAEAAPMDEPPAAADGDVWSEFETAPSYEERPVWARRATRSWLALAGLPPLVGSIVSGALMAKYRNDRDAYVEVAVDRSRPPQERVNAQLNALDEDARATNARNATLILVSAGAALEISAMVLWLMSRKYQPEPDADATALTPWVGPGMAGLTLSGTL